LALGVKVAVRNRKTYCFTVMSFFSYKYLSFLITITELTFAQTVTNVPSDTGNDRFATEYQSVIRPGLSLNGFDNTGATSKGLGLKQVLNAALSGDTYIKNKLNAIFSLSIESLQQSNLNDNDKEDNSIILQYTAFEALASYVLEENGIHQGASNSNGLNIRSHSTVMAELQSKFLFVSSYSMTPVQGGTSYLVRDDRLVSHKGDYVKNVKSFQNIARAVDLYLALENAYNEFSDARQI